MLPVQPKFPHPSRMIYEALRRLQHETPTAAELFDEIHRLYPSVPRPRAQRTTPPRVVNGITIPSPKVEDPYPDHPVRSLEVLDKKMLTSIRDQQLIKFVWQKEKKRHGYVFTPTLPVPLPPSSTSPSFSSSTAEHRTSDEAPYLSGTDSPSFTPSTSSSSPVSDALASSPSPNAWSRPLDVDGLPSMPGDWDAFRPARMSFTDAEELAWKVGIWKKIESLRPHAKAVVLSHRPRDRRALLDLPNDEIVAIGVQPPRKRDPYMDKRPPRSEEDQLKYELKLFSGFSKRKQRVTVPKELKFRRWREATEATWVEKGSDALYEVQAMMEYRREEEEKKMREMEQKQPEADRKHREFEEARQAREAELAHQAAQKVLYGGAE